MHFSKKELNQFPFEELHNILDTAAKQIKKQVVEHAESLHYSNMEAFVQREYRNKEMSFEGSLEELYPFQGVDPKVIKIEQTRVKKDAFKVFAEKYDLQNNSSWLLPQLVAHIAKIPLSSTPEGLISSKDYLMSFAVDDFHKGIWSFCTHSIRGDILSKQYTPEGRNYSSLVPLLLMPHKRYNNIPYSKWDTPYLDKLIDSNLYEAMTLDFINSYSNTELLEIRTEGLTYKSGKNIGSVRNAQTSSKLYSMSGELKKLPWLAQVMLFQIWVAHPVNRTDLMVLDWKNWDSIPDPLVTETILTTNSPIKFNIKPKSLVSELPWD